MKEAILNQYFDKVRKVYCNRTLNFKSIKAIGYDMDYTLVHYAVNQWEKKAFEFMRKELLSEDWPVEGLSFDPKMSCRGLIIDTDRGNLVKANRFGFIKKAQHGTQLLSVDSQHKLYSRTLVDLAEKRWIFLNTFFSLSEGCLYAQLVDLFDQKKLPLVLSYSDLYEQVKKVLDMTHTEGRLKAEIIADPEKYVMLDPEAALVLFDQHYSGKKLLLITNSEWSYTSAMMSYSFDRFLPTGMTWIDLFDLVVVGAGKPEFFLRYHPLFEVVNQEGLLKPSLGKIKPKTCYLGGSAQQVEKFLGLSGDEILYVGDHMFGDVHVTKNVLRWRTSLIVRELEEEIQALTQFKKDESHLNQLVKQKEEYEAELCRVRIHSQRSKFNYGPKTTLSEEELEKLYQDLRSKIDTLDQEISFYAKKAGELNNSNWGLLMRAGNDKSYLAYQLERYADIYTSRVSNLLKITPYAYLRSIRGSLPHDFSSYSSDFEVHGDHKS